ncbi:hypothetical protein NMY22_g2126 [Coprinellus aureogranulatus]|nr:hypothetical protein NMY22_g2126 [Coprinellus aureogranulatus]
MLSDSPYCNLLPFETKIILLDAPFPSLLLKRDHASQPFLSAFDSHVRDLLRPSLTKWGVHLPATILLGSVTDSSSSSSRNTRQYDDKRWIQEDMLDTNGKLLPTVQKGLFDLTTGLFFADLLLSMNGHEGLQAGVLQHKPLGLPDKLDPTVDALGDLEELSHQFLESGIALRRLRSEEPPLVALSTGNRLAREFGVICLAGRSAGSDEKTSHTSASLYSYSDYNGTRSCLHCVLVASQHLLTWGCT